jgi:hypothetical protein
MDEGKILIVNLSRGQVGEDNAAILGALMVTKIQLAAMSRANVPMEQRRPFYLYVDEFQNFATDSFAVILSEARKYQLNLTVANQYIGQMPDTVKDAVFGNVGSMITFRVGADDSSYLGKYYEPTFEAADLVKLHNRHMFISMSIDGEKALPFSGTSLSMPETQQDLTADIIANSRAHYAVDRHQVEAYIDRSSRGLEDGDLTADEPAEAQPPSHQTLEQKPNTFLGGLKNPAAPQRTGGGGSNQGRRDDRRRDGRGREDRQQRPAARPEHKPNEAAAENSTKPSGQQELEQGEVINIR